jgi:hypothetical protein
MIFKNDTGVLFSGEQKVTGVTFQAQRCYSLGKRSTGVDFSGKTCCRRRRQQGVKSKARLSFAFCIIKGAFEFLALDFLRQHLFAEIVSMRKI